MDHYTKTRDVFDHLAIKHKGFYSAKSINKLQHTKLQLVIRWKVIHFIESLNYDNLSILDIGCGNGDLLIKLAKAKPGYNFTGVDFSKEAIKLAQLESSLMRNTNFNVDSILDLHYKDDNFDVALCINTLHHIRPEEQVVALKEMARVSKKYIVIEIKNDAASIYKIFKGILKEKIVNVDYGLEIFPTNISNITSVLTDFELIKKSFIFTFSSISPIAFLCLKKK